MAKTHTAMLPVPDLCREAGLNVLELDGWKFNKRDYFWTTPDGRQNGYAGRPNGHIHHHTATSEYTPNVVAKGKTKANMYAGLARAGTDRLFSTGDGIPIVVFASAGPANFSHGKGWKRVLTDFVARDVTFPGPARKHSDATDDYEANRFFLGTEIVHKGDGSQLDPGVFELQCQVAAIIDRHFGWSPARNIGHEDSTTRKVDPRFAQGAPYTMAAIRARVDAIQTTPPSIEEDNDMNYYPLAGNSDDRAKRQFGVERFQVKLGILEGGNQAWPNRRIIEEAGMELGLFDGRTETLLAQHAGDGKALGPNQDRRLDRLLGEL